MLAFIALVLGYVVATALSWRRAFVEAQRVLPVAWMIADRMERDVDQEREIRERLDDIPNYHEAQEAARRDPTFAAWIGFGATLAYALKRPFFVITWALSKRYRREIVCRLVMVAAMCDYEWDRACEASIFSNLNNAQHELMHMLNATDGSR